MSNGQRKIRSMVVAAAAALILAGCSSTAGGTSQAASKNITLGVVSGWNDMTDIANLYKYVLDKNGYNVKITELSDISTMYVAGSKGEVDAFSSSPSTIHKSYYDHYKSDLAVIGSYYDNASIYLAVPGYVSNIRSIADLNAHASELKNTIVGIEPGSGIVATTQKSAFPAYDLTGHFQLQTSSTAAMNAALKDAVEKKSPIVVTAWSPYWLNSTFKLRKLEDPKGAYGKPYTLDIVSHKGFSKSQPAVAKMISGYTMTSDEFNTLDYQVYQQHKPGQEQQAVAAWLKDHPDVLKKLESGLKG